MKATNTSSTSSSVPGSMICPCVSRCEGGISVRPLACRRRGCTTVKASIPLTRTTPIPPTPGGVAIAAIVSFCIVGLYNTGSIMATALHHGTRIVQGTHKEYPYHGHVAIGPPFSLSYNYVPPLYDDENATSIAASVMRQMWRPLPPEHPFPSVSDWGSCAFRVVGHRGFWCAGKTMILLHLPVLNCLLLSKSSELS